MISVLTTDQSFQWDSIVKSFHDYDVYWLSGYVKAFQIHGDGTPLLVYYDNNDTRGINVVMKRDIAKDKKFSGLISEGCYYDFATAYGYGGWIIEGNNTEKLFYEYSEFLNDNNIISEFVRFHPLLMNHVTCEPFYDIVKLGEVVHIDLSSSELVWSNYTSNNRNMIRKAIKNNVKIYNGRFPEIFGKFREIYDMTMDRDNAEDYYYFKPDFYTSILEDLFYNAQVFWAEIDSRIIAASIILFANSQMNYHLSGSVREFSNLAPTNLLLHEAANWGLDNGYKTFYLGGGVGSREDGLLRFKKNFNRNKLNHFYIGKKIIKKNEYNYLQELRGISKGDYFPLYRMETY